MDDTARSARVLVVEDDPSILLGLRLNLEGEGYRVGTAEDGAAGLERARSERWDLIILDVMLPKLNGYELLGSLRAARIATPVLVLSARTSEVDKVMGLDLGAADYLTKPFSVPELLARVRAVLRRHAAAPQLWTFGAVVIDADRREVQRAGRAVDLSATEFNLLLALVQAAGRTLSREQIFSAVWGAGHHGTHRTIDNFIGKLRAKLEDDPDRPSHLLTVRGVGYRVVP